MLRLAKPMFLTLILHFAKEILKDIKKKIRNPSDFFIIISNKSVLVSPNWYQIYLTLFKFLMIYVQDK